MPIISHPSAKLNNHSQHHPLDVMTEWWIIPDVLRFLSTKRGRLWSMPGCRARQINKKSCVLFKKRAMELQTAVGSRPLQVVRRLHIRNHADHMCM